MPRPEILFPIFAETETLPGIGPKLAKTLDLMGIATIRDLILTLPINGVDRRRVPSLRDLTLPAIATVLVKIKAHSPPSRKGLPYRVYVQDDGLEFTLVFFRGQKAWFEKSLPIGETRLISGKAELFDGQAQITHPDYILAPDEAGELPEFEPIYPLSAGLSAKVMARAADAAVKRAPQLAEWIDPALKAQKSWPDWADAVALAHAPQSLADLSPDHPARLRLAYDELFAHQLTLAIARQRQRRALGRVNAATGRLTEQVLQTLPYELTQAQQRCIAEIHADMAQKRRMSRLLQGDVGAGKTIVA
ncbi:MAG: ATP-dependent DNA helicase RecG, partial [Mangrovicoccus sp.]